MALVGTPAADALGAGIDPVGWNREAPETDPVSRLTLLSLERSLDRVGIEALEGTIATLPPTVVRDWFDGEPDLLEVGTLRTCQRFLLFALLRGSDRVPGFRDRFPGGSDWTVRRDADAVRHLYRVAAGLESRAPGERQIRDQVRAAASNVLGRYPRPVLKELLVRAAAVRVPGRPSEGTSVADLAVAWLRGRIGEGEPRVLVIGVGTVGRRVAERLFGVARVTVLYRHRPPEADWSARWTVRARPSTDLAEMLAEADAVVAAAKTTGRILSRADLPDDPHRGPRWFVDLGVPRNIDPGVVGRPGSEIVDLGRLPRGTLPPEELVERLRDIDAAAEEASADLARVSVEPWADTVRHEGERIRREELARALAHTGPIPEPVRIALDRLSERLVRRLLAGPTAELRALPAGPEADWARRRLVEMLREPPPGT